MATGDYTKVERGEDRGGKPQWYWHRYAANHEPIAHGVEPFYSEYNAQRAADRAFGEGQYAESVIATPVPVPEPEEKPETDDEEGPSLVTVLIAVAIILATILFCFGLGYWFGRDSRRVESKPAVVSSEQPSPTHPVIIPPVSTSITTTTAQAEMGTSTTIDTGVTVTGDTLQRTG